MISLLRNNKRMNGVSPIVLMAFPIIIQGLIFQLQSITDKGFLGNLNPLYLSAIGAAQFPFNTTLDSLVGLCTGVTILVSQMYGAKKIKEIKSIFNSSIIYTSIFSFSLFILWFFFSRYIFLLMRVDQSIIDHSVNYVRICSIYLLFLGVDSVLQSVLLGLGKTKLIMYTGIIKVTLNIFLDWVLIFGHLGFPALEMEGAAIATTIANVTSFFILIIYCLIVKRKTYQIHETYSSNLSDLKKTSYKNVIKLGLPTCVEFFLWNFSNLILVKFLNSLGVISVAIYTITFSIQIIVYMIFNGIAKSALTLVGHKIGQKDTYGAKTILSTCMCLNFFVATCFFIICTLFPKLILSVFTNDKNMISYTLPFLIMTSVIIFPQSINVIIGSGIRAYGNTKWMLYSQVVGSAFVISCSYILINFLGLNVKAIYITILLDEFIRSGINTYYFYRGSRLHKIQEQSYLSRA